MSENKVKLKKFPEHGYEVIFDGNAFYHHVVDYKLYWSWITARAKEVQDALEQELNDGGLGPQ